MRTNKGIAHDVDCADHCVDIHACLPQHLEECAQAVGRHIADAVGPHGKVGISYSGGVDSAVLAALAARHIGSQRTLLILAVSPSLARRERRFAHAQAAQLGLRLIEISTDELSDPNYAANPATRCYFCKDTLFATISSDVVAQYGLSAVAYGENADDSARSDRPGGQAAREHAVLFPLATAGITKTQVRNIASALGMSSATKPAAPCLASRIPHGQPVTAEKLTAIDMAEDAVLAAGFSDCRVRHHGEIARIEVPEDELHKLADSTLRTQIVSAVKNAGFAYATVDMDGLKSGLFTLTVLNSSREDA